MRISVLWWLTTIFNVVVLTSGNLRFFTKPNSTSTNAEEWPRIKKPFRESDIQSPTNVETTNATVDFSMPGITFHRTCDSIRQVEILNTGYYLEIKLDEKEDKHKPYVVGGPLYDERYMFEQMHFHWGKSDVCGSEHRVDGKCHSTEVHMVFYKENYGSFEAATENTDGIAVISFFGDVTETDNPYFAELCTKLAEIREPNTKTIGSFKRIFKFVDILFQQKKFLTFPGTLTTKPYKPCVTWIMCTNPFKISSRQLGTFRQLLQKNGKDTIDENVRPLQYFRNRPLVRSAFKKPFRVECDKY